MGYHVQLLSFICLKVSIDTNFRGKMEKRKLSSTSTKTNWVGVGGMWYVVVSCSSACGIFCDLW